MRPLRHSINVTLDGCCDHREGIADEELHRHAIENLNQADALLFGRVICEMLQAAWRIVVASCSRESTSSRWFRRSLPRMPSLSPR